MWNGYEYHRIKSQLAILQDVVREYPTASLPNVIKQLEARLKEMEKQLKDKKLDYE